VNRRHPEDIAEFELSERQGFVEIQFGQKDSRRFYEVTTLLMGEVREPWGGLILWPPPVEKLTDTLPAFSVA
jgi:hypothetical protein